MANINCQETLKHLLLQGNRIDGRELFQNRDLEILFGTTSTGSVEVSLGQSKVFTTTKAVIVSPSPARPSEGMLKFRVDIQLLNEDGQGKNKIQQGINPSDSRKYQMEIEKILERMIKNSKLLILLIKDPWMQNHYVSNKEKVSGRQQLSAQLQQIKETQSMPFITISGCILSLLHFRRPQVQILPFQGVKVFTQEEKRFMPLSIHHIPLTFTFAILEDKENSAVCIDPQYEEEMICKGRITIGLNIYGDICYIHKPGGLPISSKLLSQQ